MIKVEVSGQDNISQELKSIQRQLRALPRQAHAEFVDLTPVRSGNARRRTRLNNNTITADYAYATRLDQGSSRQAPQGMTDPWTKWMAQQLKRIFGR